MGDKGSIHIYICVCVCLHHLLASPKTPPGGREVEQVQGSLSDNLWVKKSEPVGVQWDVIWYLLPKEEPVPQRLKHKHNTWQRCQ